MVSYQSTNLSKNKSSSASTALPTSRLEIGTHSVNATFFSQPTSDVVPFSHPYPPNLHGSSIPAHTAVNAVPPSTYYPPVNENDTVIVVMGTTGVGKSFFINTAAGRNVTTEGINLKSETQVVQSFRCYHPSGRQNVVLVDTPGFDPTNQNEKEILSRIAQWLEETYRNNVKVTGILYLHRISDVRMASTPLRALRVFKGLCGDDNLKNVVLVTTMWDRLHDESAGFQREEELRSDFWKYMIDHGSNTYRFACTRESAWEIINRLDLEGPHQRRMPLQIQWEMVDCRKPLQQTTAATTSQGPLARLAEWLEKVWDRVHKWTGRTASPRERARALERRR